MTESLPITSTPKRKRDDLISEARFAVSPIPRHVAKSVFSFQSPKRDLMRDLSDEGNSSPRSKVVQGFKDLAIRDGDPAGTGASELDSKGGATTGTFRWIGRPLSDATIFDFNASIVPSIEEDMQLDSANNHASPRKRAKASHRTPSPLGLPITPPDGSSDDQSITVTLDPGGSNQTQNPLPLDLRQSDSKPRTRTRAATPPPSSKRKGKAKSTKKHQDDEKARIVDPERAALTWQEDEITVYDPEDKDDDGTGINGIGFKPTAAVAYQRAQKRRQQLAEYRRREESEARARRNQRRREHLSGGPDIARRHSSARVHFSDTPSTTVMTT